MANNFSGDANCIALYTFEDDWPTNDVLNDSKGGNNMATQGGGTPACPDRVAHGGGSPPYEGTYATDFEVDDVEYFDLADGSTDAGFFGKSSGGSVDGSGCFWFNREADVIQYLISKYDYGANKRTYGIEYDNGTNYISFVLGYNGGASFVAASHTGFLIGGQRYHIGFTYDDDAGGDGKGQAKIRIWDDNGSAFLQSGGNDTLSVDLAQQMSLDSAPFALGARFNNGSPVTTGDCLMDEVVIFKDVLSDAEIDEIRAGTYGAAVGLSIPVAMHHYKQQWGS